jgi:hypothetical protein
VTSKSLRIDFTVSFANDDPMSVHTKRGVECISHGVCAPEAVPIEDLSETIMSIMAIEFSEFGVRASRIVTKHREAQQIAGPWDFQASSRSRRCRAAAGLICSGRCSWWASALVDRRLFG